LLNPRGRHQIADDTPPKFNTVRRVCMPPFFRSLVGLHSIIEPTLNFSLRPASFHKLRGLFGSLSFAINYVGSQDSPTIAVSYCCEEGSFTRQQRASERGICEPSGLPPVPSKHVVDCGGIAPSNYQCNVMAHKISLDCLRTVWKGPRGLPSSGLDSAGSTQSSRSAVSPAPGRRSPRRRH
jgi:hypothetical protein